MPYMIVRGGTGNPLTYRLGMAQEFSVESISADVSTVGAAGDSVCDAIYRDNAGLLIARSRSSGSLPAGLSLTMTFAPELPDTFTLGNYGLGTVITSGLADTILPPGGTVAVQVSDPAATVTQMRLWVEDVAGSEPDLGDTLGLFGPMLLVPGPGA